MLELDSLGKRHWHIESCSAVTGEGLLDGFDWCVEDIGARISHARLKDEFGPRDPAGGNSARTSKESFPPEKSTREMKVTRRII